MQVVVGIMCQLQLRVLFREKKREDFGDEVDKSADLLKNISITARSDMATKTSDKRPVQ